MLEHKSKTTSSVAGFSLLELIIAMTLTIAVMAGAGKLLATSFNVRTREDSRSDAIADVQRGINIMSREIAVGGYGFDGPNNGLVPADCSATSIRVRANLNRYTDELTKYTIATPGEDVKFLVAVGQTNFLVRYDKFGVGETVLANRVDSLAITYLDASNTAITTMANVGDATTVRITVGVNLPAVGRPGTPGYQPGSTVQLTSDVAMRNKKENIDTF
jgi:Tfp pilus assembly protein PilW